VRRALAIALALAAGSLLGCEPERSGAAPPPRPRGGAGGPAGAASPTPAEAADPTPSASAAAPSPRRPRGGASATRGGRFLALGDSYTVGEGVAASERWPERLAARLRREGWRVADPEVVARTGWTTAELDAGIDGAGCAGPYALVTLMIGVNDHFRGRDFEAFRPAVARLLERAVALAGGHAGRVVVLSIPDWGRTPFAAGRDREGIAAAIDRRNAVLAEEADRVGARYVDVTAASRRVTEDPGLVATDGLHPAPPLHDAWVDAVLPAARAALPGRAR